jgi:NTE family protein
MFTYRLNLYGGITIGDNLPSFYQYRVGGIFEQPIANYKQFAGYQFASLLIIIFLLLPMIFNLDSVKTIS